MILSYDAYFTRTKLVESRRELLINIFNQFEEIKPVMNEAVAIIEMGVFDMVFENEEFLTEENLMQKMKAKFDAAVQIAKEKGKKALTDTQETIVKLGGAISNVIKLMVQKLKEWVSQAWQAAKAGYAKVASAKSGDIKKVVTNWGDDKKQLAIKEIGHLKSISSSSIKWVTSGFVKDAEKGAMVAAKEDANENLNLTEAFDLAIIESLNESIISGEIDFTDMVAEGGGIPYISPLAHKLHHVPPFNLLHKVQQAAEKVAAGALNKLSYYATELTGAPGPFEFVALAAIIGIFVEVQVKGAAKHAIVALIPGVGTIASIISWTAMAMAIIGVTEALLKNEGDKEEAH